MRKMIVLSALLVLVLSLLSTASATVSRDAATIAASYNGWASAFGATDITWDQEIESDETNSSIKYLYTDDLIIKYDFSDYRFDVEYVLFQCNGHGSAIDPENNSRILAFFAALEHDPPTTFSQEEIDEAYAVAQPAFEDYIDVVGKDFMRLYSGDSVILRKNEYGTYFLFYNSTAGFCIGVE